MASKKQWAIISKRRQCYMMLMLKKKNTIEMHVFKEIPRKFQEIRAVHRSKCIFMSCRATTKTNFFWPYWRQTRDGQEIASHMKKKGRVVKLFNCLVWCHIMINHNFHLHFLELLRPKDYLHKWYMQWTTWKKNTSSNAYALSHQDRGKYLKSIMCL